MTSDLLSKLEKGRLSKLYNYLKVFEVMHRGITNNREFLKLIYIYIYSHLHFEGEGF